MKTSNIGINLIKKYEGLQLSAYRCPGGMWTIGWGHTKGVAEGMKCTSAQAEQWLRNDIIFAENAVNDMLDRGYVLTQAQYDALVSFTFNCGVGNLDKLHAHYTRSIAVISDKILLYNKSNGRVLAGLTKRRTAESKLIKESYISVESPCIFATIAVRNNYNIRSSPENADNVVGNTTGIKITQLLAVCGDWVKTEHGWVIRSAFYDTFK